MIFQQDRTLPHFSTEVRMWFNEKLNGKWIDRTGPISWAPSSPHLMSLGLVLWEYIKTKQRSTILSI